jgi:hypothetical protein
MKEQMKAEGTEGVRTALKVAKVVLAESCLQPTVG